MATSMERATLADAAEMAPSMRQSDRLEVEASLGYGPLAALAESITMSNGRAWTFRVNGEILCIWGVVVGQTLLSPTGLGVVWALTSTAVDRNPLAFYKASLLVVQMLKKTHRLLVNAIDARYEAAVRWARRIGFEVSDQTYTDGASGLPFYRVALRGEI